MEAREMKATLLAAFFVCACAQNQGDAVADAGIVPAGDVSVQDGNGMPDAGGGQDTTIVPDQGQPSPDTSIPDAGQPDMGAPDADPSGCTSDAECMNDGNVCTKHTCNFANGLCVTSPDNGKVCDDGNPNTVGDHCSGITCVGTIQPPACVPVCTGKQCGSDGCDGLCGECGGGLVCVNAQCVATIPTDGTPCDDGDPCSEGDEFWGGVCAGTHIEGCCLSDAGCDEGEVCMIHECVDMTPPDGTPCNDGDACTSNDCWHDGECFGQPIVCDDENPCTTDSCLPAMGCKYIANALPCDDGDPWTTGDHCEGGTCQGTAICQPSCAGKECGSNGCGGSCGSCGAGEACQANSCVMVNPCSGMICNDGNACTQDQCADGQCQYIGAQCADGNLCTTDSCNPATGCQFTPKSCDDGDPCTFDSCSSLSGNCTHQASAGCCSSQTSCPAGQTCQAGSCVSQPPPTPGFTFATITAKAKSSQTFFGAFLEGWSCVDGVQVIPSANTNWAPLDECENDDEFDGTPYTNDSKKLKVWGENVNLSTTIVGQFKVVAKPGKKTLFEIWLGYQKAMFSPYDYYPTPWETPVEYLTFWWGTFQLDCVVIANNAQGANFVCTLPADMIDP